MDKPNINLGTKVENELSIDMIWRSDEKIIDISMYPTCRNWLWEKKHVETINPQAYLTSEPITVTLNIDDTETEQIFPTKDLSVTITEEASPKNGKTREVI